MKKILSIFLVLCLISSVFAYENGQKIWSVDSDVYEGIKSLYIMQGLSMPSSSGPWSTNELLEMTKLLKDDGSYLYEYVLSELNKAPRTQPENGIGFNFSLDLNTELYTRTNPDVTIYNAQELNYEYTEMTPFLQFNWETFTAEHFYGYIGFDFRNCFHNGNDSDELGTTKYSTNILLFQDFTLDMNFLSFNFPQRALVSFGGNHWNVALGKDRLSWGHGETGNLVISDNIPAHYFGKFTAFYNSYKYSFLTSFFPHQSMYWDEDSWDNAHRQKVPTKGIRFYLAHRMEGRFFNNKLSASLTEAIMYQSEDGSVNPRIFNPVDVFHNYYIRGNANSTLALELDYTPINHLNIYGQFLLDEFALPGEDTGKTAPSAFPNAHGLMLGAKTSFEMNEGIFYASLETVKTDPFLYLRYNDNADWQEDGQYGIDYVVGFGEYSCFNDHIYYDENFLGYKYGGDAFVLNLNAGWNNYKNLSIEGNLFFMLHGTHDLWTCWTSIGNGEDPNYPKYDNYEFLTSTHPSYNNKNNEDAQTRNAISQTVICGFNVTYKLKPTIKFFAQPDFIFINNYGNHAGVKKTDFQVALGANINFEF